MDDHRFYEGNLPSAYRYNFEQNLFNTKDYRLLQSTTHWISFYVLNEKDLLVEGQIHFNVKDGVAKSSIQSPFGGVEVSESLSNKTLFHFIEFFCTRLEELKCRQVTIIDRPLLYDAKRLSVTEAFMQNLGFAISTSEIGSVIKITTKPFSNIIHSRKKRKLNQSLGANFQFSTLNKDSLSDVYYFIESHRKEKKYTLSVSLPHLLSSIDRLPESYQLFGLYHDEKLVAASVAVRVRKNILYHFISDHVRKIGEARPALVLMEGIYNWCQENSIQLLDLGTSASDGMPNFKLIKFKTELAGQPTQKLTFTKGLS